MKLKPAPEMTSRNYARLMSAPLRWYAQCLYDVDKALAYLACKTDQTHEGIAREASEYEQRGEEALTIKARSEAMVNQFGSEKVTALAKYQSVTALTKEQAKEILLTVFPDAPETEMARAILLCVDYHLNPLMGHVFLIPFKKGDSGKSTWATVIGIKAKRLLASRRRPFSYVDDSPRLMSPEEQTKIYGKVDTEHIVAITVLQDPKTGAQARGYGKWLKSATAYGTDKGNSPENMAFIRSESQALDRLCPGEMPMGVEVIDESYASSAGEGEPGVIEGEVVRARGVPKQRRH